MSQNIITRDEAWKIISNQVAVQEQLRTKGEQTLRIIVAIAILVTGTSLVSGYNFSESEFEQAASSTPIPTSDLYIILGANFVAAIFLSLCFLFLLSCFLYRNYKASRHSSLQPNLGGEQSCSVLIVANDEYRELITNEKVGIHQYQEWIMSNHESLSEKRQQLSIANTDITLLIILLFLAFTLSMLSIYVAYIEVIIIDVILILFGFLFLAFLYWTRDESLLNWRTLPLTEQQKADFPYMDTEEFNAVCITYGIMTVFTSWALCRFLSVVF